MNSWPVKTDCALLSPVFDLRVSAVTFFCLDEVT